MRMSPEADAPPRSAVLLVNLGTPDAPTAPAVRRYLAEFLHDHRVVSLTRWLWCPILHFVILPLRGPKVAHKYASIWMDGGSPLAVHTRGLATSMQARMPDMRVVWAMRYGNPSIASVVDGLRADGVRDIVVLPLYPQYSTTTTASVQDVVDRLAAQHADTRFRTVRSPVRAGVANACCFRSTASRSDWSMPAIRMPTRAAPASKRSPPRSACRPATRC